MAKGPSPLFRFVVNSGEEPESAASAAKEADGPRPLIKFEVDSCGQLELVIVRELWPVLQKAAKGESPLKEDERSVRISLLDMEQRIASIQTNPGSQQPPCIESVSVRFIP